MSAKLFTLILLVLILLSLILWAALICFGCFDEIPARTIDLTRRTAISHKNNDKAVRYAYLPQFSHAVAYQRHYLLIEYLKEKTGLKIRQVFPDTFDEHMRMVGQGKIDISFSNPFIYIDINKHYGAKAFARVVERYGEKKFRGKIICRSDNKFIRSLEDCKGKTWIAVDPFSAGGYLYPLGYFISHGISPEDFAEISFTQGPGGKQEKVILAVYSGKYDLGTIREGALNILKGKIDIKQIKVLGLTKWYPGWVYAARRDLDPVIVEQIKKAMLELNYEIPRDREILDAADMTAIIPSLDSDYNAVRDLFVNIWTGRHE